MVSHFRRQVRFHNISPVPTSSPLPCTASNSMLSRFRQLSKLPSQLRHLSHLPVTPEKERFSLSPDFVRQYEGRKPPFGFGDLSEIVYLRTYSRSKPDGKNELWYSPLTCRHDTVARVVNGTYEMQRRWIQGHHLGWDHGHAQASAQGESFSCHFYFFLLSMSLDTFFSSPHGTSHFPRNVRENLVHQIPAAWTWPLGYGKSHDRGKKFICGPQQLCVCLN